MKNNVTSAAAWKTAAENMRKAQCEVLELPSGATVKACRPGLETWMLRGRIPEALSGIVLALRGDESARRPLSAEDLKLIGDFNRSIVIATVVEPRIAEGRPGEGEIGFAEIPDADIDFILAWARRAPEVASLEAFRERAGLPAGGAGGADVRPAAQPDARHPGSGPGARCRRRGRGAHPAA